MEPTPIFLILFIAGMLTFLESHKRGRLLEIQKWSVLLMLAGWIVSFHNCNQMYPLGSLKWTATICASIISFALPLLGAVLGKALYRAASAQSIPERD